MLRDVPDETLVTLTVHRRGDPDVPDFDITCCVDREKALDNFGWVIESVDEDCHDVLLTEAECEKLRQMAIAGEDETGR